MKDNNTYYFSSYGILHGALDFGICNGTVYYITANGEIWLNRLSAPSNKLFSDLNEDTILNFYRKSNFIKIANLNSFPTDSLTYRNKLFVFTEDGTFTLNLSLNHNKTYLKCNSRFKPISVTKGNGIAFFSFGDKGFSVIRTSFKRFLTYHYDKPSSQIITNRNMVLNIFPDTFPEFFKISSRQNLNESSILSPLEDANLFFREKEIMGRDIMAPYSTPNKLVLPTIDKDYISLELLKKESPKLETANIRDNKNLLTQFHRKPTYNNTADIVNIDIHKVKSYNEEETACFPLSCHYFHGGFILEFWDRVVYISKSNSQHILVEEEEINQVRTYPNNPRYSNLVTVATEKACYLIYIPTEDNFEDATFQIIDPSDSTNKLVCLNP